MGFFTELKWLAENMFDSAAENVTATAKFVADNPGKAALGAAVGVGAVAAAPFTGGGSVVGGVTLAASLAGVGTSAAFAGATGVAVSAALDSKDKEKARREGAHVATAKHSVEMNGLREELSKILCSIEGRESFLVTSFAVGICAANADHEICDAEKIELEELVAGLGKLDKVSDATKTRVETWYNTPPNLNTVWQLIENNGFNNSKHIAIFDKIVQMVVWADDEQNYHEKDFIEAWNSKVA